MDSRSIDMDNRHLDLRLIAFPEVVDELTSVPRYNT